MKTGPAIGSSGNREDKERWFPSFVQNTFPSHPKFHFWGKNSGFHSFLHLEDTPQKNPNSLCSPRNCL